MGDMLVAIRGVKDVAHAQLMHHLAFGSPGVHLDPAVQHDEHLGSVVHVPLVGLIRPVQAHRGGALDPFDPHRLPGAGSGEVAG